MIDVRSVWRWTYVIVCKNGLFRNIHLYSIAYSHKVPCPSFSACALFHIGEYQWSANIVLNLNWSSHKSHHGNIVVHFEWKMLYFGTFISIESDCCEIILRQRGMVTGKCSEISKNTGNAVFLSWRWPPIFHLCGSANWNVGASRVRKLSGYSHHIRLAERSMVCGVLLIDQTTDWPCLMLFPISIIQPAK